MRRSGNPPGCVMTASTTASLGIPDDSVDYVFTDPPFGENIYYADLNFLVESWHGVLTNAAPEAIVDRFKKKGLHEYQRLMQRCFEEYQRVLKPGRWITVVFHNSRNAVWTAIQEAMLAAGFVVADVRTMDKQQGSYRQVTSTAVKQDLVISAYKPNDGPGGTLHPLARHRGWSLGLSPHPSRPTARVREPRTDGSKVVAERQPHLLFDRMVAFHVLRNVTVPLSIGEFLAGLVPAASRNATAWSSFLEQVAEYDKKRLAARGRGAARDLRRRRILRHPVAQAATRPQTPELPGHSPAVHPRNRGLAEDTRMLPELSEMLDQNFLHYGGVGEVPSQIHAYLSTNFKELRNLPKDHPALRDQGQGPLVRARPQQGGRRGDAAHARPPARVRGIPQVLHSEGSGSSGSKQYARASSRRIRTGTTRPSSRSPRRFRRPFSRRTRNSSSGTTRH